MFKSIRVIFFLIPFLFSSVHDVFATHAMGADLTYRYLGPGPAPGSIQYELTYSLYRDCAGIRAPIFIDIHVTNSCGYTVADIYLEPTSRTARQISPLCPSELSTCNGGMYTGIEEWIYKGTVWVPGECSDWTFSHGENARNLAITTLVSRLPMGSGALFVYSTLDNTNGLRENSPTFSNKPVPFVCLGQQFCFNHGAFDVENDSLTYELITPRIGPNLSDTVEYLPGYTSTQPILSNPPMSFNSSNGDFCMTPTQLDISVFAVLVKEFRNGKLIGQVERDVQVTVITCSNTVPVLTGIDGSSSFQDSVCAGSQLCFSISSIDPDLPNTTKITWDNSIPGATFITANSNRDSATFCWTPTSSNISQTPYCFTATVADDNCPYIGLQVYSYCIKVMGVAADAGTDQTITCGNTATLNGLGTGGDGIYNYTWNPGGINSQQLTNAGVGTYYLLVNSAGCTSTDTVEVKPGAGIPIADFFFSNNCSNMPVQFSDSSIVLADSIVRWVWKFGNGNIEYVRNPLYQYPVDGIYTVTLTVTSSSNCTSTISKQVAIISNTPTAKFSSTSVCLGNPMSFNDASTGNDIHNWFWEFNDPQSNSDTSSVQNPMYTFSSPGNYTISLIVTDSAGCKNKIDKNVFVNYNPVASFSHTNPSCENNSIFFTDSSFVSQATISNWIWNFDNGQTSFVQRPVMIFNSYGNYNVSLQVKSDSGCSASTNINLTVSPSPDASFTNNNDCEGKQIAFTNQSSISDGSVLNYEWNLGDNFNASADSITHLYNSFGTYQATLFATSIAGCIDSISKLVNVFPLPDASFKAEYACEDQPINFIDQSTIAIGFITSWNWTFGDNLSSIEMNPEHTFTDFGNYDIHLFISSDRGCEDSSFRVLRVVPKPVVDFITENACLGTIVNLTDQSYSSTGSIVFYEWSFGDGSTDHIRNPMHEFISSGSFDIGLRVTNDSGCTAILIKEDALKIYPIPDISFNAHSSEADDSYQVIHFENETTVPCIFSWSFGDGDTSKVYSPVHMYSGPGSYEINLYAIDLNGCVDSARDVIDVSEGYSIFIPNTFTPNGDGKNDFFEVSGNNLSSIEVLIYDRWGLKIIEWNDLKGRWDGKINGNAAQEDTYIYHVSAFDANEKNIVRTGHVNLIR